MMCIYQCVSLCVRVCVRVCVRESMRACRGVAGVWHLQLAPLKILFCKLSMLPPPPLLLDSPTTIEVGQVWIEIFQAFFSQVFHFYRHSLGQHRNFCQVKLAPLTMPIWPSINPAQGAYVALRAPLRACFCVCLCVCMREHMRVCVCVCVFVCVSERSGAEIT
jgi:hypothetical protein